MFRLLAGIVVLSLVFAPARASSQGIDLDGTGAPCRFDETSPPTMFYQALGVTFGGNGSILNDCGGFGVYARSGRQFWALNRYVFGTGVASISFLNPVQSFSFWAFGGATLTMFDAYFYNSSGDRPCRACFHGSSKEKRRIRQPRLTERAATTISPKH